MMPETIKKLRYILTRHDKRFLLWLFVFSIFISVMETVGISAVMPFIAVASDFSLIDSDERYSKVYSLLGFHSHADFVVAFGILLILFYIFRSAVNLLYFYLMARFSDGRYYLIAYRLFENYMGMPYREFVRKNSSVLMKSIINEAANLTQLISSALFMMSEIFVAVFIYSMMLWVNAKITLLLTIILFFNALFLTRTVSRNIKKIGIKREELQKRFYEIINRSFGNFKLIKLQSNDEIIMREFADASRDFAYANIANKTLSQFPRLFLEAIGFGLIVFIVTYLVWKYENDIGAMISVVSMFVLALYRLMPSVNRIMSGYNAVLYNYRSLEIVHNDLMYDSESLGEEEIPFERDIVLERVSFGYEENEPVLRAVDLEIAKGEKVAFVGESGSGKSTLVDLIIGLYRPSEGAILVDGTPLDDANIRSWRRKIGYIPQAVYLFDGTVGENVAFDRPYDREKIEDVLKKAKIFDFLQSKSGTDTRVGEGGVMLSGGQKQRIAIASALYGDPDILVLDEATSALDDETERQIMDEIYETSSDKTLIVIAHRLSTIDRCQKVYKVQKGNLEISDMGNLTATENSVEKG